MTAFTYSTEDEVIDAALHIMDSKLSDREYFTSPLITARYFQLRLAKSEREIFSIMFLSSQNQMIATEDIFLARLMALAFIRVKWSRQRYAIMPLL